MVENHIRHPDGSRQYNLQISENAHQRHVLLPQISCSQVYAFTHDGLRFCNRFSVLIHKTFFAFQVSKNVRFALTLTFFLQECLETVH